jgi:hypothetical protein
MHGLLTILHGQALDNSDNYLTYRKQAIMFNKMLHCRKFIYGSLRASCLSYIYANVNRNETNQAGINQGLNQ